jgi:hypothetical protein
VSKAQSRLRREERWHRGCLVSGMKSVGCGTGFNGSNTKHSHHRCRTDAGGARRGAAGVLSGAMAAVH